MGNRYPAPRSAGPVHMCVMKIIVVNLPFSASTIATTLGPVILQLGFVAVIMTKHPAPAIRGIKVGRQLNPG